MCVITIKIKNNQYGWHDNETTLKTMAGTLEVKTKILKTIRPGPLRLRPRTRKLVLGDPYGQSLA